MICMCVCMCSILNEWKLNGFHWMILSEFGKFGYAEQW